MCYIFFIQAHPSAYEEITNASLEKRNNKDELKIQSALPPIEDEILKLIIKERSPLSKMNSPYLNRLIAGKNLQFLLMYPNRESHLQISIFFNQFPICNLFFNSFVAC